jgi:pyruvate dehydrogenase E1 component beta subunit
VVSVLKFVLLLWKVIFFNLAEAFDYLDAPVERVTGVDVPMPYAVNLEKMALPQQENIANAVRRAVYRKKL